MIRYSVVCDREHVSDSWFRDSAAFDAIADAGHLTCPLCGSSAMRKALMAPSLVTRSAEAPAERQSDVVVVPAAEPSPQPVVLMDDKARHLRAMIRELHQRVTTSADDVGKRFAVEARAIHDGEAPSRSIYGEATRDEVSGLLEDGIPLLPLPVLPDEHH